METANLEQAQVSYNQGLAHLKSGNLDALRFQSVAGCMVSKMFYDVWENGRVTKSDLEPTD